MKTRQVIIEELNIKRHKIIDASALFYSVSGIYTEPTLLMSWNKYLKNTQYVKILPMGFYNVYITNNIPLQSSLNCEIICLNI